ncbi:MAG: terminase small subunit [Butyricicoccaceae bacterium]
MTEKQKRFADEYLVDSNATQAAVRAGYSKKTAGSIGQENLKKPEIKSYIDEELARLKAENIADAQEVMEYLTSVLRGESRSSVLCMAGEGTQEVIEKPPDEKEKLKAAELLGRRYSLFTDKMSVSGAVPVVISGEDDLED